MFRRGFRRFFRGISARSPLASPPRLPDGGRLCALFPWPAFVPLFAAHHLDAAKVTELLLWILAFTTYVILGLVILVRIGRSIKEGKNSSPDYGSESEMFRDLCRRMETGDVRGAAALQLAMLPLIDALFSAVNPIPVKTACAVLGLCSSALRPPLCPMEDALRLRLEDALDRMETLPGTISE